MLKHKKFYVTLIALSTFALFSCQKVDDTYTVKKEDPSFTHTTVEQWKENYESGEELSLNGLVVKFNDKELKPIEDKDQITNPDYYFLCTNSNAPSKSYVLNLTINSNTEDTDLYFYLAHIDEFKGDSKETTIYVSDRISVHVHNSNALKPWVWYVVSGVVVFGVVAMVFFTRQYKAKKEGKL